MGEEPSDQHQRAFCSDPGVGAEEKGELGLGFQSTEERTTTSIPSDPNLENPTSGENSEIDGNLYYDSNAAATAATTAVNDDDEEAERLIKEELIDLIINLAIDEHYREENGAEAMTENVELKLENWENENVTADRGGKFNGVRKFTYPLRPDAEDCAFYMKTGSCKFGPNCKFNHPPIPRRKYQGVKERTKQRDETFETHGQTECKYYLTSGGCKYGKACKYNHTRERYSVALSVELNFLGLPIRLGEKECTYYMRNGSCKFGSNCRFNHPDPTAVVGGDPSSGYGNGESHPGPTQSNVSSWSSPRPPNEATSYVPMMYSPSEGIPSTTEWNSYQAPVYTTSEKGLPTPPAFTMNTLAAATNFSSPPPQMVGDEFPQRPGQPECSYFLNTGDCKYKFNCKFHHPKTRIIQSASYSLSDKGLPLRPDQAVCSFYNRYGICKFGPSCKYDHPEKLGTSVSSGISSYD